MCGQDPACDRRFMDLALALGRRGLGRTWPNPSVGAVVVGSGPAGPVVLGRGWTQPGGRPHAETEALRRAGAAARGAIMYVSLEPCSHLGKTPPCVDAIAAAGITRVVSALEDPNPQVAGAGHRILAEHGIAVDVGVGADMARRDHDGHSRRMCARRPHVTLKLALSSDGKVALAGYRPAAITAAAARARVHLMRATHDAVITGIGTAIADDPQLTCRLPGMTDRSPVRVVLDSALRLPLQGRLAATARDVPVWAVAGPDAAAASAQALQSLGVKVLRMTDVTPRPALQNVLQCLSDLGISRVLVEAGPSLATAFVKADLVDEVVLFRSPDPIGDDGIDALEGLPLDALVNSPRLTMLATERIGVDSVSYYERI
jgi:diaminohydroxyphosphoribosylaminopyrimidine deaminase/5-amino-6-(5-phosphoribosylamino)uracil reductase